MTSPRIGELARSLDEAWARAMATGAPTTIEPSLTAIEAYAIQDMIIAGRLTAGRRIAGWKLGLTSARPPTTPIAGTLLDDMVVPSGIDLSLSTMVAPLVEAEVVVEIGATLEGPASVDDLLAGPHRIAPGIEVIDYRTTGSSGVVDWIADNSTVAYAVVGDPVAMTGQDIPGIEVELSGPDGPLATGRADLVMGNPLAAVAWLSGHLAERGRSLEAGQVVLTGSLTGHHAVPGSGRSSYQADFGALGSVSVSFHDDPPG
jgi:2-keto-4-pentenoate hydratase